MPAVDPVNAKDSGLRVVRGAAWNGTLQELRVAHRSSAAAQERAEDLGLRLVSRP